MCFRGWCRSSRQNRDRAESRELRAATQNVVLRVLGSLTALGLVLWTASPSAQMPNHKEILTPAERVIAWLEDVQSHTPGAADGPAIEVANWPRSDLEVLAADLKKLSAWYEKARASPDRASRKVRIFDRSFGFDEIEKIFSGNATLLRGAFLHSDIALFVKSDLSRSDFDRSFAVDDGRGQGMRHRTAHWRMGRLVLDALQPAPSNDPAALLWYRAVSAYLLREGQFAEARIHLDRAAEIFPSSPDIALDNAYLREKFASPEIQAAVEDYRSQGILLNVESERTELGRAERFLRQTLELDPEQLEARIRHGRVLGDLGRHHEAIGELQQALSHHPADEAGYFTELFLGREEEILGNHDSARIHFETAAHLFPDAQSPRLGLSQLARQRGDRAMAQRALGYVFLLGADELYRKDPWWSYFAFHGDDVEPLFSAAHARVFGDPR
jgi:tetratricopeptide (TPR) repeat protein